ncbi:hypothetical protein NDU88_007320 [Pleurodeles waltl]|uniref:Uncharacterized protein n=1 Tax=Pleurodeles waltl TaxID=8319 RepID=A0AAV7UNH6_PLEWA|nr:hypothetical protein NDU88_007320 [Pleurodeles waltl]
MNHGPAGARTGGGTRCLGERSADELRAHRRMTAACRQVRSGDLGVSNFAPEQHLQWTVSGGVPRGLPEVNGQLQRCGLPFSVVTGRRLGGSGLHWTGARGMGQEWEPGSM